MTTRRPQADDGSVSVVDTTEIRWFVPGPLPLEVRRWFTGSTGVVEERRDIYLLDDRADVGVKYRGGAVLELKVRRGAGPRVDLGDGLVGDVESWRKWSPADGLVDPSGTRRRVDVDKVVVKRRFSPDGIESRSTPVRDAGPGCDVEIAAVTVGRLAAWTLAFAAFGPPATCLPSIDASWRTVRSDMPPLRDVGFDAAQAMAYPEWLARTVPPGAATAGRYCGATKD